MSDSQHSPLERDPALPQASGGQPAEPLSSNAPIGFDSPLQRENDFELALLHSSANLNPIDLPPVDIDSLAREFDSLMARTATQSPPLDAAATPEANEPAGAIAETVAEAAPPAAPPQAPMEWQQVSEIAAADHVEAVESHPVAPVASEPTNDARSVSTAAVPLKSVDESLAKDIDELLKTDAAVVGGGPQEPDDAQALVAGASGSSSPAPVEPHVSASVSNAMAPVDPPQTFATQELDQSNAAMSQGAGAHAASMSTLDVPPEPLAESITAAPSNAPVPEPIREIAVSSQGFQQVVMPDRGRLKKAVLTMLLLLNLPFRFVPRSLWPAMNWVAITLMLWVPVVWFVLPMLVKHDAPPHTIDDMHHQSILRVASEPAAGVSNKRAASSDH